MEYSAVSEVLDADYEAAGTCSEDLYVHAFNPVGLSTIPLPPKGSCSTPTILLARSRSVNDSWLRNLAYSVSF